MNTVKFGTIDSYDLGILLASKEIGEAAAQTVTVEVPFMNGNIDLTDYYGEVRYSNRPIKMNFTVLDKVPFGDYSAVCKLIHGQMVRLTFSDDPDYYYYGRASVSKLSKGNDALYSFSVEADCKPFKFLQEETVVEVALNDETVEVICNNTGQKVIPTFETTGDINITFGGTSYSVNEGTHILTGIVLDTGDNALTISGTATVKIRYQEGVL